MENNYPIIIIGMHRSGTSLICRLLEDLGLFVGSDKEENNESVFFMKLNDWILKQVGASWDNPKSINSLLEYDLIKNRSVDYLKNILDTKYFHLFLGEKAKGKQETSFINIPWGWKDPRNTFTLPLWLELFPKAKVIHIMRNGVDVAVSLKVRHGKDIELFERKWRAGKYNPRFKRGKDLRLRNMVDSVRCLSLEGGFSLWEEYVERAQSHMRDMGDRGLTIRYEDFLENPFPILQALAGFCGLNVAEGALTHAVERVNAKRANAFKKDPELSLFAQGVLDRLRKFGYELA